MQTIVLNLNDPEINLELEEDTKVLGLFVGRNSEKVKTKIRISHARSNLTSRIKIKAVVYDKAKFDAEALVEIPTGAKFTDTYLDMHALIMDKGASARAVPSLEIQEDEVQGGHGATVGMIDAESIHYLMSRGLAEEQSKNLLVNAFIEDIQNQIEAADE